MCLLHGEKSVAVSTEIDQQRRNWSKSFLIQYSNIYLIFNYIFSHTNHFCAVDQFCEHNIFFFGADIFSISNLN